MRSFNNSSADLQQQHLFKRWWIPFFGWKYHCAAYSMTWKYENKNKKYENTKICAAANIVRTVQNPSNLRSRENFHSLDQQNLKEVKQNNQSTDFSCSSWRSKLIKKCDRNISLFARSISSWICCRFCRKLFCSSNNLFWTNSTSLDFWRWEQST